MAVEAKVIFPQPNTSLLTAEGCDHVVPLYDYCGHCYTSPIQDEFFQVRRCIGHHTDGHFCASFREVGLSQASFSKAREVDLSKSVRSDLGQACHSA